jgi:hypothetical protein
MEEKKRMAFKATVDEIDFLLASLPWREEGRKLVLRGLPPGYGANLMRKPGFRERVSVFARQAGLQMAQIFDPGTRTGSYKFLVPQQNTGVKDMTSSSLSLNKKPPQGFVWFGGLLLSELEPITDRMKASDIPTGLVQPVEVNGVIKTIQWGINKASVELFGFDALSLDDMKAAIQRDTSGDWYGEDLLQKQYLYRNAGTKFEQVARIRTKTGWISVRFKSERTGIHGLVLSQGEQVSEVASKPESLILV